MAEESFRSRLLKKAREGLAKAEQTFQRLNVPGSASADVPVEATANATGDAAGVTARVSRPLEALGKLMGEFRPAQAAEATVFLTDLTARSLASAQSLAPLVPSMLRNLDPLCWSYLHSASLMVHSRNPGLTPVFVRTAADQALQMPKPLRHRYLSRVLRGAHIDPGLALALASSLPGLLQHLPELALDGFLRTGFSLWKTHPERAQAFFRLESRASQETLGTLRQGLPLEQVRRSLQLYAQSLAGMPVPIRSVSDGMGPAPSAPGRGLDAAEQGAVSALPRAFTDGRTLFLPPELAVFAEREENFRLFKAMTALEVGRLAFGSFRLDERSATMPGAGSQAGSAQASGVGPQTLVRGLDRGPDQALERGAAQASALLEALQALPSPGEARGLFELLETWRIEQRLRQEYPGLGPDLEKLTQQGLLNRPLPGELTPFDGVLEALLHALSGSPLDSTLIPVTLQAPLSRILEATTTLSLPDATVRTTLLRTREAMLWLREAGVLRFPDLPAEPEACHPPDEAPQAESDAKADADQDGSDEADAQQEGGPGSSPPVAQPETGQTPGQGSGAFEPLPHQSRLHLELAAELEAAAKEALRDWSQALEGDQGPQGAQPEVLETPAELESARGMGQTARDEAEKRGPQVRPGLHRSYPEWDSWIEDYKDGWAQVIEEGLPETSGAFAAETLATHGGLVHRLKRQFQHIRKEELQRLRRQDDGDEVDIDAAVEAIADQHAGLTPSDRLYTRRVKHGRDVAVAFLVDMSSSTQQLVHGTGRSILDIEKESLLLMAEALESLGDAYAIYGFSGYGRARVSFYVAKEFDERYEARVKCRISGMSGRLENRDGAAIRHATHKLVAYPARVRLLILLSDGRPLDCGCRQYFERYAQEDTRMALQEARRQQVHPFCITVDRQAQRYLSQMYSQVQYTIIDQVSALPERLPLIYRRLTT